mgnify:FL=1
MNQFDNFELTTLDYTLKYYLEHNELLDDDDIEWCNLVRKKIDTIMELQAQYSQECV